MIKRYNFKVLSRVTHILPQKGNFYMNSPGFCFWATVTSIDSYPIPMFFTISAWKLTSFGERELGRAENFAIADLTIFI